ncbi:MAG: N-acetylneuraminate lyase [Mesorhizobium sp.]|nr:N-acetylneuraminate lyase [bacterium M00.F.Ca.ET.205.01.1.1]TGU55017.1 N-acetylneuraminate lyase [bacterium M00.F.Ca.ET.152.01.1.1]TGV39016.1 N-acetylneuraminate lyase [Mesorhizobium sp. M00.F.Ca.ET.186.01.1.1]TGZ44591.1 N-acetylneuraminate lyase [bacterium M00.F.Ca.ET.162.01.1.1]TJW33906.1 MAG: N-acetylneuraminate lyase [Mesorhizobium sp.]
MYAALMTGLSDAGEFDPKRQRNINDYVLRQGLAGLYVGGSSGESGLLTVDELLAQQQVVAAGAAASGARLIAHVGMPNLRDSIRLAQQAQQLGYQALSALPPHSYPFSDEEVFGYYEALTSATDLPLIVYEIPLRTGRPLPLGLLARLLDLQNVVGIKFTSTDLFKYAMLRKRQPQKLFYYGFDEIYAAAGMLGTEGGIGTTYNLLGRLYVAIDQAVRAGDLARARALQMVSQDFVAALLETGVLPGMKAAFRAIGVDCGPTRAPMTPAVADAEQRMREVLARPAIREWLA